MPAYSTHCIFARELLPFLYTAADFEINEEAVMFGTQGPDIFFFHRVFPWMIGKPLRKIGSQLHRAKPADILQNMRDYCNTVSTQKSIAKSYVYGFILHYALDRNCHPFVYSYQYEMVNKNPLTNPHTAHNIVELSADSYFLNALFGIPDPVVFDTACTVGTDDKTMTEIGKLYAYILPKVLDINVSDDTAKTALKDMKRVQAALYDTTGIKRFFVSILENIAAPFSKNYKFSAMMRPRDLEKAKNYVNIHKCKWKSPFDGSEHTESFEDLFELAKLDAKEMIVAFQNNADTWEITHNISFLTGVETK